MTNYLIKLNKFKEELISNRETIIEENIKPSHIMVSRNNVLIKYHRFTHRIMIHTTILGVYLKMSLTINDIDKYEIFIDNGIGYYYKICQQLHNGFDILNSSHFGCLIEHIFEKLECSVKHYFERWEPSHKIIYKNELENQKRFYENKNISENCVNSLKRKNENNTELSDKNHKISRII